MNLPSESVVKTLLEREELEGDIYPLFIERIVFLLLVIVAILLGLWMWNHSKLNEFVLWAITIVILPIGVLSLTEGFGRIMQKIRFKD